jgi:capsular exopolysaccharide synthesis family protein
MPEESMATSLEHLRNVVTRHRWKILTFMALATALTVVYTNSLTKLYEATVQVNVERRSSGSFIGQQAAAPEVGSEMDRFLTTQVELAQSDPVLRPATEKFHLLEREHQVNNSVPGDSARSKSAPIKLKRLRVSRVPNTYLIQISYRADNPQLAANVANMIAESYIAHAFDSRNRSYVQVGGIVAQHLKDLRTKMVESGQKLATFARELNLIDPEQRINLLTTRLLQLNNDYTSAQSERLKKEAVFQQAKVGSIASVEASAQGATLEHLLEQLNIARQRFVSVRTTFGENNPEYKRSANEVTELERQVRELQANALERVAVDYRQALAREDMALKIVADTKREVDALNGRVFDYQELKSEAQNYKTLYEDLQRVTNEGDINRTFQDTVIQIETPARPAAKEVFPILPLNVGLALFFSGFLSVVGALLQDALDTTIRSPQQLAKLLNVKVIATLPKTRKLSLFSGRDPTKVQVVGKMPKTERTRMLLEYYESIRALRNAIGLLDFAGEFRSVLITSANAGEGKSTLAANLAFSYGLLGKKVLLIDADLRHPSLHKFYQKSMKRGLAEVIEGKGEWKESLLKIAREQVFLLPAGKMSESSPDLIATGLQSLLAAVYAEYDVVLIDAPPLCVAESLQLAALSDAVLVVARAGATKLKQISAAYGSLAHARANIIGLVINDASGDYSQKLYSSNRPLLVRVRLAKPGSDERVSVAGEQDAWAPAENAVPENQQLVTEDVTAKQGGSEDASEK